MVGSLSKALSRTPACFCWVRHLACKLCDGACGSLFELNLRPGFFFTGLLFVLLTAAVWPLNAQMAASGKAAAVITFTLDFPASDPSHYSISLRQDGHGTYESAVKDSADSEDRVFESEFEVSAASRERIFALTKQAEYFAGKIDSGKRKLAFTGTKTLSYQDGTRKNSADFNYSTMPAVQQLTGLFESMASTLDYGRMLAYSHRYQKLALDDELKHMETQARNNELSEIGAIAAVLQEIVDDASVINVVRARAQRLIDMGKRPAGTWH